MTGLAIAGPVAAAACACAGTGSGAQARAGCGRRGVGCKGEVEGAAILGQAGLVERSMQLRLVAHEQHERVGALDRDLNLCRAVERMLDADLDAAQLSRLELNREGLRASLLGRRGKRDLDRLGESGGDLGG